MAGKTYALMKLREIINGLNQIDADYHTGSYSAMDMSGAIMLTSENIADNCIRAAEIQQNFSSMSAKVGAGTDYPPAHDRQQIRRMV